MKSKRKGVSGIMNETTREQAVDAFVMREIYACQSALVEEALKRQMFTVDQVENLYRPFDGELLSPSVCFRCKSKLPFLDSETGQCENCYEETQEPQEIFEWWLVSSWFGRKLLMEGEPILDNGYGVWWGRTTTGQVISMDYVIEKIYDDIFNK